MKELSIYKEAREQAFEEAAQIVEKYVGPTGGWLTSPRSVATEIRAQGFLPVPLEDES